MRLCESQRRPCSAAQSAGRDPSSRSLISPHSHPVCHVAETRDFKYGCTEGFFQMKDFYETYTDLQFHKEDSL